MSALGHKRTLVRGIRDVRFNSESRHAHRRHRCLLSANSGDYPIPFALALGLGNVLAARAAPYVAPRWLIIGGGVFVLGAMLYGSTLNRNIPYFPDLVVPIVVGGFGIGVISVILPLCAVAEVGPREIGPVSSITLMVQNLGGPLMLVVIQAVQTSRTLYLGGTTGPVKDMIKRASHSVDSDDHIKRRVWQKHRQHSRWPATGRAVCARSQSDAWT